MRTAGVQVVFLVACLGATPVWAAPCHRYGDIVTLRGHYAAAVMPDADGTRRDLRTDSGRRADVLTLDAPLCVDADVLSGAVADALSVQVHCVVTEATGDDLSLTGRLVGAALNNGHTPVLLVCRN